MRVGCTRSGGKLELKANFRLATGADIEKIVDLCNECFFEETPYDYAKEVYEKTKDDENQIYLIGELDGNIIAHAKITVIPTIFEKMNTYAILNHVCVKPEYRRHNIATQMLKECERISKERNCIEMKLWSMNFRQPAHACYKHYGFDVNDAKFFSKTIN